MNEPGTIYQMAEASQQPNGLDTAAPPPPPSGPRERPRIEWLDFPQDCEYPDFKIRAWVNYPNRLDLDLSSNDPERMRPALARILVEHNGWIDQDDQPYPPAGTPEFWESLSNRLGFLVMAVVKTASTQLPNSLDQRKRR